MISWKDITVKKFQQLHAIAVTDLGELDKSIALIAALLDKPIEEVERMAMEKYLPLARKCSAITDSPIPGKHSKQIKIGRNRYRVIRNLFNLPIGNSKRIKEMDSSVQNIHRFMASIVEPVSWLGKKKNVEHEVIAQDFLNAKFIDVYHTYKYFTQLLEGMKKYN